jgi:nitrate reductase (NAD(P)H)
MEDPNTTDSKSKTLEHKLNTLPPTPPATIRSGSTSDSEDASTSTISATTDDDQLPLPPPTTIPTEVLETDKKTPDGWLPRDPRLIRLTGVHPFNVEAPLTDLFNEGFLTSPELFYVRNHGAVPKVEDESILDWEFAVDGYVSACVGTDFAD